MLDSSFRSRSKYGKAHTKALESLILRLRKTFIRPIAKSIAQASRRRPSPLGNRSSICANRFHFADKKVLLWNFMFVLRSKFRTPLPANISMNFITFSAED